MKDIDYWEDPLGDEIPASDYKSYQHEVYRKNLDVRLKSKSDYIDIQYWRFKTLDYLEIIMKKSISGKCMEIGSGMGLASAYLSSKESVASVTTLDYSINSLKSLLPEAHSTFKGANHRKIRRVYGTYNNIKDDGFDYIFGFGAIHNSPNLSETFQALFKALRPGGIFMSSDMCLPIAASISTEQYLSERQIPSSIEKYGKELKFKDTNDYFRNVIDYLYFAKSAGFTVTPIIFDKHVKNKKLPSLLAMQNNHCVTSLYPIGSRGRYDNSMLICQKLSAEENKSLTANGYTNAARSSNYYFYYFNRAVKEPRKAMVKVRDYLTKRVIPL